MNQCYQPSLLFLNDPQWANFDVFDSYLNDSSIKRTFYKSTDGTCTTQTDYFIIPLHEKVGPIGDPRPCGQFYFK
jgi:hypothetical protein